MKTIKLADKETCCGCAACYNACENNAISMEKDMSGFLYPVINDKCIGCGICQASCPVIGQLESIYAITPQAYVVQHKDERIRSESTSGGGFSAFAESIIDNGGVVFGAAMDAQFKVSHTFAESKDKLNIFRNSKYVQSEIGLSFRLVENFLNKGRKVLYSGTPCQIHGLLKYLGENNENLITVDIVCHSVPSPAVFEKYIELQLKKYPNTNKIVFRDKKRGYDYSTMALYHIDDDGKERCLYRQGSESDLWFRSFLPGLCDRDCCYQCQFQNYPRISDITIWDCFNIKDIYPVFDDNKGTTSVVAWTEKGRRIVDECDNIKKQNVPISCFMNKIKREEKKKIEIDRKNMYKDLEQMGDKEFFNKYRRVSLKIRIKSVLRLLLYYLGLHGFVKKMIKKVGYEDE